MIGQKKEKKEKQKQAQRAQLVTLTASDSPISSAFVDTEVPTQTGGLRKHIQYILEIAESEVSSITRDFNVQAQLSRQ